LETFTALTGPIQGRSVKVSGKRARMGESKFRVPLRRSSIDLKENWKIKIAYY
jgi:hypothetical protein